MEEWLMSSIGPWIFGLLSDHPIVGMLLLAVGFLRVVMKPIMEIAYKYVEATPYDSDDKWLHDLEQSKGYKSFLWLLDWLGSVKLPAKK